MAKEVNMLKTTWTNIIFESFTRSLKAEEIIELKTVRFQRVEKNFELDFT